MTSYEPATETETVTESESSAPSDVAARAAPAVDAATAALSTSDPRSPDWEPGPLPLGNKSYLAYLSTQFLGALNDNVYRQTVMLLCAATVGAAILRGEQTADFQPVVQALFALPFLLFSGVAGDLSDRLSKGWLMVACKVGEIVVMTAALVAFLSGANLWTLAAVAFLMGAQSAFFGPPKYGGLPELVRKGDLTPATGLVQMTTFLAIILGMALAGVLVQNFGPASEGGNRLFIAGAVAVGIAVLGTITSLFIAKRPAVDPTRRVGARSIVAVFPILLRVFKTDPLLRWVMLAYSYFWFLGGVTLQAINVFGIVELGLTESETSLLLATLSIGMAIGSVSAGRLSRGRVRIGLIVPALIGIVASLLLVFAAMLIAGGSPATVAIDDAAIARAPDVAIGLAFGLLLLLGTAAGVFAVPLLAFIQARPNVKERGVVFAADNFLNWVFIIGSAGAYALAAGLSNNVASHIFAGLGVVTAVIGGVLVFAIMRRAATDADELLCGAAPAEPATTTVPSE